MTTAYPTKRSRRTKIVREQVVFNVSTAKVQRKTWNGKTCLVANATMIVPGVLPGNKGPINYPEEVVANSASAWEGMPMLVNHPSEETVDGVYHNSIGAVRFPKMSFSKKLGVKVLNAQTWFFINETKDTDIRVYDALVGGKPISVSTGLKASLIQNAGRVGEREYHSTVQQIFPDHLAILIDQPGACSLNDGCGINNSNTLNAYNPNQPRDSQGQWSGGGGGGGGGSVKSKTEATLEDHNLFDGQTAVLKDGRVGTIVGKKVVDGHVDVDVGKHDKEVHKIPVGEIVQATEKPKSPGDPSSVKEAGRLSKSDRSMIKGQIGKDIASVTRSTASDGTERVHLKDKSGKTVETMSAASYKELLKNAALSHDDIRQRLQAELREKKDPIGAEKGSSAYYFSDCWVTDVYDKYFIYQEGGKFYKLGYTTDLRIGSVSMEEPLMAELVEKVSEYKSITNTYAEEGEGKEEPASKTKPKSNKSPPYEEDEEESETEDEEMTKKQKLVNTLITNGCGCWQEADRQYLEGLEEDRLAVHVENMKKEATPVNNSQPPTTPKQMTDDDWKKTAPDSVLNTLAYGERAMKHARTTMIQNLVGHIKDDGERTKAAEYLENKGMDELEFMVSIQRPANVAPEGSAAKVVYNYLGAGGGRDTTQVNNGFSDSEDLDMAPAEIDWSK